MRGRRIPNHVTIWGLVVIAGCLWLAFKVSEWAASFVARHP